MRISLRALRRINANLQRQRTEIPSARSRKLKAKRKKKKKEKRKEKERRRKGRRKGGRAGRDSGALPSRYGYRFQEQRSIHARSTAELIILKGSGEFPRKRAPHARGRC